MVNGPERSFNVYQVRLAVFCSTSVVTGLAQRLSTARNHGQHVAKGSVGFPEHQPLQIHYRYIGRGLHGFQFFRVWLQLHSLSDTLWSEERDKLP